MRPLYYLFILFWPALCFGQANISGKVLNQPDGMPVAGASVFLNNATIGTISGKDGSFTLQNIKPGNYRLIVSVIGFEKYDQPVMVGSSDIFLPDIRIAAKTIQLSEVKIRPVSDADREKYLSRFKDEFLGTSELAKECRIINPEILTLDYDKKTDVLTAYSPDFLIIENGALGYKIKYLLSNFILDDGPSANFHLSYKGSVLFEQLKGTPRQEKRWEKSRQEVYERSLMHFLRAALNDQIAGERFRALLLKHGNPERPPDSLIEAKIKFFKELRSEQADAGDSLSFWLKKEKLPKMAERVIPGFLAKNDVIKATDQQGIFSFGPANSGDEFYITYDKYDRFSNGLQPHYLDDLPKDAATVVGFTGGYALFDSNGALLDPDNVTLSGLWGRERIAELLPVDYEPSGAAHTDNDQRPSAETQVTEAPHSTDSLKNKLLALKSKSDSAGIKLTPEKVYVQFDKPYYASGDTVWFKAYLLNDYLTPSTRSGMLNVDVANDGGKVVRRYRFPVHEGLAWGDVVLDEKYAAGSYTLRAYTNWMRNFGDEGFFYKTFVVANVTSGQLLIHSAFNVKAQHDTAIVTGNLRLETPEKLPFSAQPVYLRIESNDKSLLHARGETGVDGAIAVNFRLPQKATDPTVVVENSKRERVAVIPVSQNIPQNADVQFLPEGGNLVAGLSTRVGFKAIGGDGKGIDVSGVILNSNKETVARFKSLHNGMSNFYLDVKQGENYTAQVTLSGGGVRSYSLPQVHGSGVCLSVINEMAADSLEVTVSATEDIAQRGDNFFLIGRARSVVCYAAIVNFNKGAIKRKISKDLFPTGVTHFTLMTTKYQPISERLVFIDRHDGLNLKVVPGQPYYTKHDSVALKIKVTDADDNPVSGNLSVAVTDNDQVKTEGSDAENIETRFLFSAGLKGYIEQPGYYFSSKTPETWQALDNLLLTQGWIAYNWSDVFNPLTPAFQPDTSFAVTGRVTNVLSKPVKGTHILLFSKKPQMLIDTTTDITGRFVFDRLPRLDTPLFVLRALNKNGKSFNVNVNVDEPAPPVFTKPAGPVTIPWYVNTDSTLLNYTKNVLQLKQQQGLAPGGQMLREVIITGKKIIKDSQNLNGPGGADFAMDEDDIEAAGKKTWLQLLEENVKGFNEGTFDFLSPIRGPKELYLDKYVTDFHTDSVSPVWYFVHGKPVKIIVDGVDVNQLIAIKNFRDLRDYLSNSTDDIKGVEIISTPKYASLYLSRFNPYDPNTGEDLITEAQLAPRLQTIISSDDVAFIEITTRGGHGPIINSTPGMYVYRSLPISWPEEFYKPKYKVTDATNQPDLRSTIDWEPNVVTDTNGEAVIWFYTADKPSTYTVTVEGTDMNGHVFFKRSAIEVKGEEKSK